MKKLFILIVFAGLFSGCSIFGDDTETINYEESIVYMNNGFTDYQHEGEDIIEIIWFTFSNYLPSDVEILDFRLFDESGVEVTDPRLEIKHDGNIGTEENAYIEVWYSALLEEEDYNLLPTREELDQYSFELILMYDGYEFTEKRSFTELEEILR